MPIYDFQCEDGHITEKLTKADVRTIRCECGKSADRKISPVSFTMNGSDPAWPTAHDKWVREHERRGSLHNTKVRRQ